MAKNRLSILLIKKNTPANLVVKQQEDIHHEGIGGCDFYYKNSHTNPPKWLERFFNNQLQCGEQLRSTSAAGVLLVRREYEDGVRLFALCFGYGRSLIMPACIEERFGLISTLNAINPNGLRSVDINRLDSSALKNRIQSSKLADVSDFEFDVEKSLLRQATGLSNDEEMGKTISGSDSLSVSVEADIDSIGEVLDRCYQKYCSTDYRGAFSWIDHIKPLKKSTVTEMLDSLLLENLQDDNEANTWLAVPDIIDWNDVSTLKYESSGDEYEDILIDDFRQNIIAGQEVTLPFLKNNYVYAYDANGDFRYRWPYYRCIYSELEHDNKLYILNAGSWFQVDTDYKASILTTYDNAPLSNINVIDYNHDDEGHYNRELANSNPSYYLMDRVLVPTGVANNSIEFCDVYAQGGKMIHVKKYGGSQVIGHLFNQGLIAARMLFDLNFRGEVIHRLPQGWELPLANFNPSNLEIIYGIISKRADARPHIPFFSMVVFHDIYHTLTGFGYTVSLKAIRNVR